jgi:hypothetical protein
MGHLKHAGNTLLVLTGIFAGEDVLARQNIVIGEMSVGFDYQDRIYGESDATIPQTTADEDYEGLYATPRVRLSSRGATDLHEFTYAPTFTYDIVESSSLIGHDSNLLAEKNINRDWLVRATNSYFYGEDSLTDSERRGAAIIPGEPQEPEPDVGGGQGDGQRLTENFGRREYWRNDYGLRTDYSYAQDSVVGAGYNFGVLRNVGGDTAGYSDYDRHEGIGRLSYRFNIQWQAETEASYVKGVNDLVRTGTAEPVNNNLEEYHGRLRMNYTWRPHDIFFGQYSYAETVYEDALQEDSAIHTATIGWNHDFSRQIRMTLSGGPTLVTYEDSPSDTGYNAFAGLVWDFQHSALTANTSYNYEYDNFDGRASGLSKTWRTDLGYSYQFTPQLQTRFSAGYEKSDREQPLGITLPGAADSLQFTDENYYTGLLVGYSFLRWYTLSVSYRYADYRSEFERDYNEHRVLLTLSASKEIFRW